MISQNPGSLKHTRPHRFSYCCSVVPRLYLRASEFFPGLNIELNIDVKRLTLIKSNHKWSETHAPSVNSNVTQLAT